MNSRSLNAADNELAAHIENLGNPALEVEVFERRAEASGIISLKLRGVDGHSLPEWRPGSHIDVATPFGLRQYSLCGESADEWAIAVLDEPVGRGGSRWLHDHAREQSRLWVGMPRDTFGFDRPSETLLIAGGIGITPILPMADALAEAGSKWRLVYTAKEHAAHAFASRLEKHSESELWASSSRGRFSVRAELERVGPDCEIYCCGPISLVDAVIEVAADLGLTARLHTERFVSNIDALQEGDVAFSVTLQRSGKVLEVPADMTLLERLGEADAFVVSSCHAGICGSCETRLVSGEADHRDQVLTDEEKAENDCIFPCVSRARPGHHLVLDI